MQASLSASALCLQVIELQAQLYTFLGSGPVAFLYQQASELGSATAEEVVHYKLLAAAAVTSPFYADGKLEEGKPLVNPAQLLGVSFSTVEELVRCLASRLHLCSETASVLHA